MKTLFTGGVKSGKSRLAEQYILKQTGLQKPYYLATTEFIDEELRARIEAHKQRRQDSFITLEAPINLLETMQTCPGPVLVECVSIWLNNMLYHQIPEADVFAELEHIMQLPIDLVLVLNEVGLGVIPDNALARQFVDWSGKAGQFMAANCDRVFFCSCGLAMSVK